MLTYGVDVCLVVVDFQSCLAYHGLVRSFRTGPRLETYPENRLCFRLDAFPVSRLYQSFTVLLTFTMHSSFVPTPARFPRFKVSCRATYRRSSETLPAVIHSTQSRRSCTTPMYALSNNER